MEREDREAKHRAYLATPEGIQDTKDMQEWNRLLEMSQVQRVAHLSVMDLTFVQTRSACRYPSNMVTVGSDLQRLREIVRGGESKVSADLREKVRAL
jgi:hypothetical protein